MTLEDHQTGREIISPYILLGKKGSTRYAVNTESFRNCQDWLILPHTLGRDTASERFRGLSDSTTIPVFAAVGIIIAVYLFMGLLEL